MLHRKMLAVAILAASAAMAQTAPQYGPNTPAEQDGQGPSYQQQPATNPNYGAPAYGQQNYGPQYQQQALPPPAQLTMAAGSYIPVRIDQKLSSKDNRPGDGFTGTLIQPLIVNGLIIAAPGQIVSGVVQQVENGSTSKLVIGLNNLTLVDGQQAPLQAQLIAKRSWNGNDTGTVVGTTGAGAVIGAAAGGGGGAAVGGLIGLVAGAIITEHHASVIYPETILTFQTQAPVTISTVNAPQAFRYVQSYDYNQQTQAGRPNVVYTNPYPYYAYPYYPYGWGPGFGFVYYGGPRYWGGYHWGGYHWRR